MSYSILEVSEDFLARINVQCRCGLEGTLESIKKHIDAREGRCHIPDLPTKCLMKCKRYLVKSKRRLTRSQHLARGTFKLKEILPPRDFDNFLKTCPNRNPNLPHAYIDMEADGLFLGRLHIELREDVVPKTVAQFLDLIRDPNGYKGSEVDFIIPNIMFQVPSVSGYGKTVQQTSPDENFELKHDRPGVLSMSNFGVNANGSGFFTCAKPMPWRDGTNVVFGYVISGSAIIRRICELGNASGCPIRRVRIRGCGLIREWMLPSIFNAFDTESDSDD